MSVQIVDFLGRRIICHLAFKNDSSDAECCKNVFNVVGKQAGASHSNLFYGNSGAKFRKEEWQRVGNQIDATRLKRSGHGRAFVAYVAYVAAFLKISHANR